MEPCKVRKPEQKITIDYTEPFILTVIGPGGEDKITATVSVSNIGRQLKGNPRYSMELCTIVQGEIYQDEEEIDQVEIPEFIKKKVSDILKLVKVVRTPARDNIARFLNYQLFNKIEAKLKELI